MVGGISVGATLAATLEPAEATGLAGVCEVSTGALGIYAGIGTITLVREITST